MNVYLELTKARLSALVLLTTAVGFVLARPHEMDWALLGWTLLGTSLCAGCASALNQIMEVDRDRAMKRTRGRPLPSGAMTVRHALTAAACMGGVGPLVLSLTVNALAAALAIASVLLYVLAYTPLKTRTTLNTLVGALCGAIPPMIGWAAAAGALDSGALVLATILFVWQLPHFFALAWLYRADYRRGGFVMLPVIDRDGRITCQVVVLTALALLPLGLIASMLNVAGYAYAMGSMVLGACMVIPCVRMYRSRSDASARAVFIASITYLPLLMCLLVADRGTAVRSAPVVAMAAAPPLGFHPSPDMALHRSDRADRDEAHR